MAKQNIHIGSSLDDVLDEDGLLEESSARAIKRVIAWQLQEAMNTQGITKEPRCSSAWLSGES